MLNGMTELTKGSQSLGVLRKIFTGEIKLWEGARFILVDVPLDRGEMKRLLPCAMRLTEPATGTLFVVDYVKTAFTVRYKEAALLVHVKTPFGKGVHCCWMVVDDDTALIYGRELLGYPKKSAQLTYEENGGHISAGVNRRGIQVMSIEADRGAPETNPKPVFNVKTFNVSGPGQLFGIHPIWLFKPTEIIHESYTASAKLTLNDAEFDPIKKLVAGDPIGARIVVMDIPGSEYMLPVGMAGLTWHARNFYMRYR